ncbi:MAG: hypothetical protein DCF22_12570 [Leptolyngbya sp.]|nr:MAG: hypothetical protein DCF22_12570 [Leptolyngbya sp.]
MRSFWSDPYLWIHLAGLAALPLWLELCFLGLAVGDPIFPVWLELALVAIAGIAPILWMQWQRPFYIFSLLAISLKPENLTLPQRQLLTRFKSIQNRLLAVVVSVLLAIALRQLYVLAPIGTAAVPFSIESRGLGLVIAAIAFLGSNLFLQVPVSVASVMLTSDSAFTSTEPYPLEQISQHFTSVGLPVSQLLPEFLEDSAIASPIVPSPVQSESAVEAGDLWEGDLVPPIEEVIPASPLESGVAEGEESNAAASEAEDSALEELIVEQEAVEIEAETIVEVAAISDISVEVADPSAISVPTESDREVEQEPVEDLAAIARIDEQSPAERSSTEEPDPAKSDPLI